MWNSGPDKSRGGHVVAHSGAKVTIINVGVDDGNDVLREVHFD